ncbi:MAG: hypothetical protein JRJ75_13730 [Deltaproteobacteria bacterium]|nr:hypothetical protein [Deltaproteobacteria bacterium]
MKNLIVSILISALFTVGGLWYYDRHYATHIAVFDMNGYLSGLKNEYVAGKLSREELQRRIADLKTLVGAQSPNTITLLKEVVLSGKVQELGDSKPNPVCRPGRPACRSGREAPGRAKVPPPPVSK